jgi:hypothetical protein
MIGREHYGKQKGEEGQLTRRCEVKFEQNLDNTNLSIYPTDRSLGSISL